MAQVILGKKEDYHSGNGTEPISVLNGTDTVQLEIEDDYSSIVISVTTAAGAETLYNAALIEAGTAQIFHGAAANAGAVYAEILTTGATGSLYMSTAGALFVQVANAGAASDWETVTTT